MSRQDATEKKPRGRRRALSTAEKIADMEKQLAALREQARREERENVEKNRKAIFELFRSERLDVIGVDEWKKVVPQVKALLGVQAAGESPAATPASAREARPAPAEAT
ncbi:Mobilization protein (plasmid) [Paraburkholderia kururiensis]|uniref:hypothetical protein n=1 Tax=Paraburkholderia kururiensis TaxID=984307 RepID=UPI0039A65B5D